MIFRNLTILFRRNKVIVALSLLGLSVALSAFYLIMSQVIYDSTFDSFHKDKENIYRVEFDYLGSQSVFFFYPVAYHLANSSPHIKDYALVMSPRNQTIAQNKDTTEFYLTEQFCYISPGYAKVFTFDMYEGAADCLDSPENALVPLSVAKKIFGNRDTYLGEKMIGGKGESWTLTIGGVYRDFPKNSMLKNVIYQNFTEEIDNYMMSLWGTGFTYFYIKLDHLKSASGLFERKMPEALEEFFKANGLSTDNVKLRPLNDLYYTKEVVAPNMEVTGNKDVTVLLLSIAIFIILIAGINYMNFSIALAPVRVKNVNTRKIMGETTGKIRFLLVLESVLIACLSYIVALLIIYLLSNTMVSDFIYADITLSNNLPLLSGTFAMAVLTGLLAGLYPAYYVTSVPPALALKGNFRLSFQGRLLRNILIGVQFFISLTVVTVVLFMNLQYRYMLQQSPGFDKGHVLTVLLSEKIKETPGVLINKLKQNPVIDNISFANDRIGSRDIFSETWLEYKDEKIMVSWVLVTPDFFTTMRIPLVEGHNIFDDGSEVKGAFIFNQSARKKYALELNEIVVSGESKGEIMAFVPDIHFKSFRYEVSPLAFIVSNNIENNKDLVSVAYIRFNKGLSSEAVVDYVREVCLELDSEFNNDIDLYEALTDRLYEKEKRQSRLISIFSLLAIFISIIGVFGLIIFETQAYRKEVGIRKVYGATVSQILYIFNLNYVKILFICFALSVPCAWYITILWLQNFAYHISVFSWVFLASFFILLFIVVLTITIQSWRAANENPVNSIKSE